MKTLLTLTVFSTLAFANPTIDFASNLTGTQFNESTVVDICQYQIPGYNPIDDGGVEKYEIIGCTILARETSEGSTIYSAELLNTTNLNSVLNGETQLNIYLTSSEGENYIAEGELHCISTAPSMIQDFETCLEQSNGTLTR